MEYPQRKTIRLKEYNYNLPGWYFITVCAKDKKKLFGYISPGDIFTPSEMVLSEYGRMISEQLEFMKEFYEDILLEKYVVMPNHLHLLLCVLKKSEGSVPTISKFVGTLKRFCNKKCNTDLWQSRSFDHVVRNEKDYQRIWEYIDNNPTRWTEDKLYVD